MPGPALRKRYVCVRDESEAETMWRQTYEAEEASRVREVHLLCGSILPIWSSLVPALRAVGGGARREPSTLPVKKCVLDGVPLIGVAMSLEQTQELKKLMTQTAGGAESLLRSAQTKVEKERRERAQAAGSAGGGAIGVDAKSGSKPGGVASDDEDDFFDDADGDDDTGLSFAMGEGGAAAQQQQERVGGASDDDLDTLLGE